MIEYQKPSLVLMFILTYVLKGTHMITITSGHRVPPARTLFPLCHSAALSGVWAVLCVCGQT